MQRQNNSKRYLFQASAIGVAGRITHPFQETIPVQAASALPDDGGYGSARVDGFRYKEILSFGAAYTEVIGTEQAHHGISETLSLSVVEKFNLLDVVTCDRIVSRLTSKYPGHDGIQETAVTPIGSRFEGLRIANDYYPLLELSPNFFCEPAHDYWTGLLQAIDKNGEKLPYPSLPGSDGKPAPLSEGRQRGVLGFCVAPTNLKYREVLTSPAIIPVPQFGTVHLGEFFCYPNSRSLNMLRVELGCTTGGDANAGSTQGGGRPYP